MCTVNLATNSRYKNKSGKVVTDTDWHKITLWGKRAELFASMAKKGSKIAVQGPLKYNSYQDKNGSNQKSAYILVTEFIVL